MFKRLLVLLTISLSFVAVAIDQAQTLVEDETLYGAGITKGELTRYGGTDALRLAQDIQGTITQILWVGDVLAFTRIDENQVQSLWVSIKDAQAFELAQHLESLYPISFTDEGKILYALQSLASDSSFSSEIYQIVPEMNAQAEWVGQIDTSLALMPGCGGGSPLPSDWQYWKEAGFGGSHRTLELTAQGIVYSLDCVGHRTGLLNLQTGESQELGAYFGNVNLSPERLRLAGVIRDTTQAEPIAVLATVDLQTGMLSTYATAKEPDQVIWSVDGSSLFYSSYEALPQSITMSDAEQQALAKSFGSATAFPLYAVSIDRYDLASGADSVIYEAAQDVARIGRLFALDDHRLVFSQIPNLQGWITAIASGQFDLASAEDNTDQQLATVPVQVLSLNTDNGNLMEIGTNISLFTPQMAGVGTHTQ